MLRFEVIRHRLRLGRLDFGGAALVVRDDGQFFGGVFGVEFGELGHEAAEECTDPLGAGGGAG